MLIAMIFLSLVKASVKPTCAALIIMQQELAFAFSLYSWMFKVFATSLDMLNVTSLACLDFSEWTKWD